jgi:hypothetical protein
MHFQIKNILKNNYNHPWFLLYINFIYNFYQTRTNYILQKLIFFNYNYKNYLNNKRKTMILRLQQSHQSGRNHETIESSVWKTQCYYSRPQHEGLSFFSDQRKYWKISFSHQFLLSKIELSATFSTETSKTQKQNEHKRTKTSEEHQV